MATRVGTLKQNIIDLLSLPYKAGLPILLGQSNKEHMQKSHPLDYEMYYDEISTILDSPDYVALNKDGSIEYVKEFIVNDDFVKIAVRISSSGIRLCYRGDTRREVYPCASGKRHPAEGGRPSCKE